MKKFYWILGLALLAWSCNGPAEGKTERPLVVCTTGMIGDAVKNLLPDSLAEVRVLMGPGVDPHLYKATQGDIEDLSAAAVIVYNGLHLEGKMGEIFEKLQERKTVMAMPARRLNIPQNSPHQKKRLWQKRPFCPAAICRRHRPTLMMIRKHSPYPHHPAPRLRSLCVTASALRRQPKRPWLARPRRTKLTAFTKR